MICETCCPSLEAVKAAVARETSRIELCERLEVGGVTPSLALIQKALAAAGSVPVNVLVRPREGDFVYSREEVQQMLSGIDACKRLGVNGIVAGALLPDGQIDVEVTAALIAAARPLSFTFHRAFDQCRDVAEALEVIIDLGADRILTSGHAPDAWSGREVLRSLVKQANGRIIIMPGCGVTPDNLEALQLFTGASEFHGSRL